MADPLDIESAMMGAAPPGMGPQAPPSDPDSSGARQDRQARRNVQVVLKNFRGFVERGYPKGERDEYLASEGYTEESLRHAVVGERVKQRLPGQGFTDAMVNGLLLNHGDEFAAAADATGQSIFGGGAGDSWGSRYDSALRRQREARDFYAAENPIASTAAEITGSLANPLMALARPVAGIGPNIAQGLKLGIPMGGVSGFGAGEGGLENRLLHGAIGAGAGAAIGGLAPPVLGAAGTVGRTVAESGPGRWVADNLISKPIAAVGNLAERVAPRAPARAASAAPPEGGPPVVQDSLAARLSEGAQGAAEATSGDAIARRGAVERLARRLERDEITPQQFQQQLEALGPDAALFLGGGPNVEMLAKTTGRLPGRGMPAMREANTAENRSIGPRMMGEVETSVAPDTRFYSAFERAATTRQAEAKKTYDAAIGQGLKVSDEMAYIENTVPAIQQARTAMEAEAANQGIKLDPVALADKMKQTLNAQAAVQYGPGSHPNKKMIGDTADRWEAALWKANPQLKAASDEYASNSKIMDSLDAGRKFLIGGTGEQGTANAADALAANFAKMSDPQKEAFRTGVASAIREKLTAGPRSARAFAKQLDESGLLREKLVEIVGPMNAERIFTMAGKEMKRAAGWHNVTGGSDTAWNAAAMAEDGIPSIAAAATNRGGLWARGLDYAEKRLKEGMRGNEAVRDQLSTMLFNANPADRARILAEIEQAAMSRRNRLLPSSITGAGASQAGRQ